MSSLTGYKNIRDYENDNMAQN